ncbi:MAG: hypothetical protein ACOXZ4_07945 [Sphaerochaetaceae bacterium]
MAHYTQSVLAKGGMPMEFVSFEDESALFETVLFPPIWQRYHTLIHSCSPLIIRGKVVDDQNAIWLKSSLLECCNSQNGTM